MTEPSGPYIQIAAFCERVLQEKDGVLTLVRVIDTINCYGPSEKMPPMPLSFTTVLSFKAGFFQGKCNVRMRPVSPSVKPGPIAEFAVYFEGNDRGVNLILPTHFMADEEGIYWFEVSLEEALVTKIPLRVLYQRVQPAPVGSP